MEESFTEKLLKNYSPQGEVLEIYTYPNPILKAKAKPVKHFDNELKALAENMLYTMYQMIGIGLAAPQVGRSLRMFVMDVDYKREGTSENASLTDFNPRIFINPIFKKREGTISYQEGCLSVPGIYEEVTRNEHVDVEYRDLEGNPCQIQADGLFSICLQHENDHLDGIVFLERLSKIKKDFLMKKYLKGKNA